MAKQRSAYIFDVDRNRKPKGIGCLTSLLLALLLVFGSIILYSFSINHVIKLDTAYVRVMALDQNFEGFRVLHISDLSGDSLGSQAEQWQRLLSGQKWNAVVMSGDMVGKDGNSEPMRSLIHELLYLNPDAPVFFVAGDGDPDPISTEAYGSAEVRAEWVQDAEKAGAYYLDAPMSIDYGTRKVWFSPAYLYDMDIAKSAASLKNQLIAMENQGLQYEMEGGANYRTMQYRLDTMNRSLAAIEQMTENDLQIAVNHIPLEMESIRTGIAYADTSSVYNFKAIDLVLCGHFCGGQYCLPWIGPVYVAEKGFFPGNEGIVGMTRMNSINLYISPGISSASNAPVRLRILNQPKVSILRFTSSIE